MIKKSLHAISGKVCPECYKEDIKEYGEAYLRVEHQLPENLVCHKHRVDLEEIKKGCVAGEEVELVVLPHVEIETTYQYTHSFYYEISEMIEKIFVEEILGDIYLEEAQEKDKSKLREKGYYMHTQLDRQSVGNDLIGYFGNSVLDEVGASLKDDIGWISSITQKQQVKLKLICHLVLIKFLFESIEAFVTYGR
ncbi:MAG: TnsD family Tn7-like transposition protein [Cellulosilyticaceae bacterium]